MIQVIPREHDLVKYRVIEIPPNFQKTQAVQVTLVNENRLIAQGITSQAQPTI